jgi:tRNA(Arg) A34 adenosine deaminase TadA
MTPPSDERAMRLAIDAARQNLASPFGAALVVGDQIVATGVNRCRADGPIWHGEIDCLHNAASSHFTDWSNATLATTAEPCPMCMSAILWAGVGRVVYGTSVPTLVDRGWNQFALRASDVLAAAPFTTCDLIPAALETECDALFRVRT